MTCTDCLPAADTNVTPRQTPGLLSGALLAAGTAFAVATFGIAFSLVIMSAQVGGAITTLIGIAAWLVLSVGLGCALAIRARPPCRICDDGRRLPR